MKRVWTLSSTMAAMALILAFSGCTRGGDTTGGSTTGTTTDSGSTMQSTPAESASPTIGPSPGAGSGH